MNHLFNDLKIIELAGVLAGPSVGVFFSELGAKVIKIENPKTGGDVTRSWKLPVESEDNEPGAYYWSVNTGKEILFLNLSNNNELSALYDLIKDADIVISNYKKGDDEKLKVDYLTLSKINPKLIYASITGFGKQNPRTAYDLILQAESGFMFMNGEFHSPPVKMPVALIDILAGHHVKEAVLIALLRREKENKGSYISVSLFDSAISSLANQATNWLITKYLPQALGSLHPNIAPYGELYDTKDCHLITFAIGSNKQFEKLCGIISAFELAKDERFKNNQQRVINRNELYEILKNKIANFNFQELYNNCLKMDIPIGKIRNMEEVFEQPEAKAMLKSFTYNKKQMQTVNSIAFKFLN